MKKHNHINIWLVIGFIIAFQFFLFGAIIGDMEHEKRQIQLDESIVSTLKHAGDAINNINYRLLQLEKIKGESEEKITGQQFIINQTHVDISNTQQANIPEGCIYSIEDDALVLNCDGKKVK